MNQLPTTQKQLKVYKALENYQVEYMLIGSLATMFYGRKRATDDMDILVLDSNDNCRKLKKALGSIGYQVQDIKDEDLKRYECITVGGETIIDIYAEFGGLTYKELNYNPFLYGEVVINVATKIDLIRLLKTTGINSEDIEVLELLDDPVKNKDELNDRQ